MSVTEPMPDETIVDRLSNVWRRRGRAVTLVGAFVLPAFFIDPLLIVPLSTQIGYDSAIGLAFRSIQQLPLWMSQIGFLVWFTWRVDWRPTLMRRTQMYVATVLALVGLPTLCQVLTFLVGFVRTEGWEAAWVLTRVLYTPNIVCIELLEHACRSVVMCVVLLLAGSLLSRSLIEPDRKMPGRRRTQFSIAGIMMLTTAAAVLIVAAPLAFRHLYPGSFEQYVSLYGYTILIQTIETAATAVAVILVALIGWRSLDVSLPRYAGVILLLVGALHLTYLLSERVAVPWRTPSEFAVFERITLAIAVVFGTALTMATFRSLGLHVRRSSTESVPADRPG